MHTLACKVLVNGKLLVYSHFSVVFLSCKWTEYLAGFHKSTVIQNAIKKGVTIVWPVAREYNASCCWSLVLHPPC